MTYIDPEKKPEIARLAQCQNFGSIFVDNDATKKHEEAKSMTEEEITGAIKRSMTSSVRTACFVTGSGESSITDTEREGYSRFKDLLDKSGIKTKELPMLRRPKSIRIAPLSSSPVPRTTTSAGARRRQEVRRGWRQSAHHVHAGDRRQGRFERR